MTIPASIMQNGDFGFRRLLVVFDHTLESMSAAESAARLAACIGAELTGLFVEDEDLLRLTDYPEASTLSGVSVERRAINGSLLRRALKVQIRASRKALERAARRLGVRASFEVRRGRISTEVIANSSSADLVVIEWNCGDSFMHKGGSRARFSTIAQAMAVGAQRSVLLLRHKSPPQGPIMIAYGGSAAAGKAISVGFELATHEEADLEILLLTDALELAESWRRELDEQAQNLGLEADFLHMPQPDLTALKREARRARAALLVMEADLLLLESEVAEKLLSTMDCSVLLVR